MKNKKSIIVISLIIGLYLIFAIVFFGWNNFKNKFEGLYIMLNPDTKWQLKDGKWSDVKDEKVYNWQKFDVYIDNQLLGNYNLLYNNKWYLFDSATNPKLYNGNLIAIKGNKKYKIIDYQEEELDANDINLVNDILKGDNISYYDDYTYAKKIFLDINGDKKTDTIYYVSNAFSDKNTEKFSLVFIKGDTNQVIYKSIASYEHQYDLCIPRIIGIIDIEEDLKYELIIECEYFNLLGTCNSLYQIKNGEYVNLKGC